MLVRAAGSVSAARMESGGGLVKRRAPEPSPRSGDVPPPELRVGKCIEVWADDGRDWCSAWRRFQRARGAWCDERGLSTAEECRLLPDGAPWSVEFLIKSGQRLRGREDGSGRGHAVRYSGASSRSGDPFRIATPDLSLLATEGCTLAGTWCGPE